MEGTHLLIIGMFEENWPTISIELLVKTGGPPGVSNKGPEATTEAINETSSRFAINGKQIKSNVSNIIGGGGFAYPLFRT